MEIQDIAKLLFQSEFGGGHMISDKEKSLKWIQEESQTLTNSQSPLAEYIGDGIVRVYLSSLNQGLRAEVLNEMFVQSAAHKKGSVKGLEEKIDAVRCVLPYSEDTIDAFFETWKSKGYPAISHSETYRSAYQPAYRVVDASYLKILDIIPSVNVSEKTPFVIAIDGMSGSGKSTLGELLHMNFPQSNLFHMDDYFLQPHQRTKDRLAEIGGNVDYERFHDEILLHLADKNGLTYRPYN